jgi:two-component system, NtrC family, sensor histidine kinase HydH
MKSLLLVSSRYIVAVTIGVIILMFGSAFLELRQGREELLHVVQEHALSLSDAITRSSANVVVSTEQVQIELGERLLNNARFIARMDSAGQLSPGILQAICASNNLYRVNIFDATGRRIMGNHAALEEHLQLQEKRSPRETLAPILRGERDQMVLGIREARFEEGDRFAVALRRSHPGGGAIVVNVDAAALDDFRKRIGIGKFINDLNDNAGIDYVLIQDREGILAATHNVQEISRIVLDSLLIIALEHDTTITRRIPFNGIETYEVARRLSVEGTTLGLLRIGLSLEELRRTDERMTRRFTVMAIVVLGLGIIVFSAVAINRHYRTASRELSLIQTQTDSILANMEEAVITLTRDGRVSIFNKSAEELFGLNALGVLGRRLADLPDALRDPLELFLREVKREISVALREGRTRVLSVSQSVSPAPDGSAESRTFVLQDLTERRQRERDAQRNEKLTAMGELASGVAHEIRNPLNAISMIAQRLEIEFSPRAGSGEYRSLTRVLGKESTRVNGIVQQFLSFARQRPVAISDVSIGEWANHVSALFRGQAEAKGVRFTAECMVEGTVRCDGDLLTQAILNLLQNALDASSPGESIVFSVREDGRSLTLEVRDTGAGIPEANRERIFNLYFSTKPAGNGMGLPLVQQIVSQHGGTVQFEGAVPRGSTFTVSIPRI